MDEEPGHDQLPCQPMLPLHKALDGRYADTVVLTFAEIEDLIGVNLPEVARLEKEWWANGDADSTPSPQSRSWIRANRSARQTCLRRSSRSTHVNLNNC